MNEAGLRNQLKPIIEDYLPALKANNDTNIKDGLFSSENRQSNTVINVMTDSEMELFNAPIKFILSLKEISERFSEEFIKNKVVELYHRILVDESKIDSYLNELMISVIQNTDDYFIASEIENIRIEDDCIYDLIDSTMKVMKEEDLPFNKRDFHLSADESLIGKHVIFTIVKAGDTEKAKEYALHNFVISFNLLRLYAPNFKPTLKGCLLSGNQELMSYNKTDNSLSSIHSKEGDLLLNHAYLNKELYALLVKEGIGELKDTTSMSEVVKECLYWFGLGLDEKHTSSKLVSFVTILEAALKNEDETTELTKTISERGALLLSNEFD